MKKFTHSLYAQVLVAVAAGAILGHVNPALGAAMRPLGEGFIKLVKMLIAPIVFTTVVTGIAKMGDLRKVGRVGLKGRSSRRSRSSSGSSSARSCSRVPG